MNSLNLEPIDSGPTFGTVRQVIVNPKKREFVVTVEVADGYGDVVETMDAWDYVAIFDWVSVHNLIGQRVRVVLRPDRAQIVELMQHTKAEDILVNIDDYSMSRRR